MVATLDAGLARLALDSGLAPRALAAGGGRSLLARTGAVSKKALRKIGQRQRQRPAATVSASSATALFWSQIGAAGLDVAPLKAWGLFDADALDRFADGRGHPDRPTLGFLINCCAIASALGRGAGSERRGGTGEHNAIDGSVSMSFPPVVG